MIKILKTLEIEGNFVNFIKNIYQQTNKQTLIPDIILHGAHIKAFPLKSGIRQGCSLSSRLFNFVLGVLTKAIRQEKEMKDMQIEKKEVKLSLFTGDMTV